MKQHASLIVLPLRTGWQQSLAAERGTVSLSFKKFLVTWPRLVHVFLLSKKQSECVQLLFGLCIFFVSAPTVAHMKSCWVFRQREGRGVEKELHNCTDDIALDKKEGRTRESECGDKSWSQDLQALYSFCQTLPIASVSSWCLLRVAGCKPLFHKSCLKYWRAILLEQATLCDFLHLKVMMGKGWEPGAGREGLEGCGCCIACYAQDERNCARFQACLQPSGRVLISLFYQPSCSGKLGLQGVKIK